MARSTKTCTQLPISNACLHVLCMFEEVHSRCHLLSDFHMAPSLTGTRQEEGGRLMMRRKREHDRHFKTRGKKKEKGSISSSSLVSNILPKFPHRVCYMCICLCLDSILFFLLVFLFYLLSIIISPYLHTLLHRTQLHLAGYRVRNNPWFKQNYIN
ncbi:hypothetical protein F4810DRAFT_121838 [Camillea tinctor]|nr:hypothetical protein F4810DRAFT_121838 [Camillea tinctor]